MVDQWATARCGPQHQHCCCQTAQTALDITLIVPTLYMPTHVCICFFNCASACLQIQSVRRLFEEGREEPPLTRNMPPVAGGIRWSRSLLGRLRRTWARLQGLEGDLEGLDAGRRASAAMTGKQGGAQ